MINHNVVKKLFVFVLLLALSGGPVFAQSPSLSPSAAPTPTGSDSVRERVEARISQAQKKARAEVGAVTDITEGSFQIRTPSGNISQVAYEKDNITIVKIGKTKSEIKPADVALGDFIVAMGYQAKGKSPLLARRILVTPPPPRLKISVSVGSVESVSKKEIALNLPGNTNVKIPPGDKVAMVKDVAGILKTVKFVDVKEGAKIIVWQTESDGTQKIRKIQITN